MSIALEPITIRGEVMPWHSAYTFVNNVEYVAQPKRTVSGRIAHFPTRYKIKVVTVTWNFMTHGEYERLLQLTEENEFPMRFWNPEQNEMQTANFYCPPKSYNAMVAKLATLQGYQGITLQFIATNNPIIEI